MFTTIRTYIRHVFEDFKAHQRGEVRVAPRGHTGRVYARTSGSPEAASDVKASDVAPEATLTLRVTRKDGTVETYVVPATVTQVLHSHG